MATGDNPLEFLFFFFFFPSPFFFFFFFRDKFDPIRRSVSFFEDSVNEMEETPLSREKSLSPLVFRKFVSTSVFYIINCVRNIV